MKRTLLAVAVATVAVFSTANLGKGAADKNIRVCHIPPGNADNAHEIDIDQRALPAHIGVHCGVMSSGRKVCDYYIDKLPGSQDGPPIPPQEQGTQPCNVVH
jgi:hypothetical protein